MLRGCPSTTTLPGQENKAAEIRAGALSSYTTAQRHIGSAVFTTNDVASKQRSASDSNKADVSSTLTSECFAAARKM